MQEYQNTDIRYCAKSFVDKWKGPVVGGHLAANLWSFPAQILESSDLGLAAEQNSAILGGSEQ